jgi:endogenous inhibitor of DNA gyrase (YacG/DUF329 family)
MNAKERNEHEALCPRCGAEAQWSFLDSEKTRIEVMCPDCGRYEMAREEFDQAAVESAELKETDRP